jgi:uncharacterized protein
VRRLPAWALAAGAAAFLTVGALLTFGHGLAWENMSEADRAHEAEMMMPTAAQAREHLALMLGGYVEGVRSRGPDVFMFQTLFFALFFFWRCGGMMLLGMALYKWGFLDGRRPLRDYIVVLATCLPAGLALAGFGVSELERVRYALPERAAIDVWNYVGAVLASVGYAAALVFIVNRRVLAGLRKSLAAVGQMAFSNYLFHSLITSLIFLGWGFGWAGRFDYANQLVIVGGIWAFQLVASPVWLRHFRFGPAEWLWRSLTYWRRQPMRRSTPLVTSAA